MRENSTKKVKEHQSAKNENGVKIDLNERNEKIEISQENLKPVEMKPPSDKVNKSIFLLVIFYINFGFSSKI